MGLMRLLLERVLLGTLSLQGMPNRAMSLQDKEEMESAILRHGLPIHQEKAGQSVTSLGWRLRLVNDQVIIPPAPGKSDLLVETTFESLVGHWT